MTVSMLRGKEGFHHKEIEKLTDWATHEPPPDLVSLPYSLLIGLAKPIKDALNRPVCCTLQGEDLFLEGLQEPYKSQALDLIRQNIEHVDVFISVSDYYAEFMPEYLGIPREKIRVVPLGINLDGYKMKERDLSQIFTVGFFARVAPEKGLHVLAESYHRLRADERIPKAHLEVAGYLAPEHKNYLNDIEQRMKAWGLDAEFHYRGILDRDEKIAFLRKLDVLSVPATYNEPKGIFLLEAMACGVPIVQPRRGAFTEIIESTGGGLLVEPDDTDSLASGILKIYRDDELANELGENGFRKMRERYSVGQMADRALEVYGDLIRSEPRISADQRGSEKSQEAVANF
jgi:glycosyltransferase involved in cell wall biosynthesis